MNISPQTNVSSSLNSNPSNATPNHNNGASVSSSKDLASASLNPSVRVTLSTNPNASAAANATVPPVYSRVSISASNENQLSPSRNPVESADTDDEDSVRAEERSERRGVKSDDERQKADSESNERSSGELSEQEVEQVEELKLRDQEVRAHEQAHKAVGGQYTGSISLDYQAGPDGKRYAVGGEVPIDVSPIAGDPQATIAKMNTVKAAAIAPAEPSAQDRSVAATAARLLSEAQAEIASQRLDETVASEDSEEESETENVDERSSAAAQFEEIAGLDETNDVEIDTLI